MLSSLLSPSIRWCLVLFLYYIFCHFLGVCHFYFYICSDLYSFFLISLFLINSLKFLFSQVLHNEEDTILTPSSTQFFLLSFSILVIHRLCVFFLWSEEGGEDRIEKKNHPRVSPDSTGSRKLLYFIIQLKVKF